MKYGDVQNLQKSGFSTDEQRQKIVEHFNLKEDNNRFLVIISFVGAVLVAGGILLLIAANWDAIPRGVKLATGLGVMLAAHAGGWWLREVRQDCRKTGEALHLVGSLLFLGNIALIGQIYHLVSSPPNAFLLWWAGIAALPWLLKSEIQHLLALLAFGIWFGMEMNAKGSRIQLHDESQVLAYALLGLIYVGFGYVLRRGPFASFAKITERLGLLALLMFSYPLTWPGVMRSYHSDVTGTYWILPVLAVAAGAIVALDRQWRWTWGLALFVFCLLQIQVGLQARSADLVNLGVVFITLDIIAAYLGLFGTMAFTGLMFVVSVVFQIVFGVYLEKKRRALMKQIISPPEGLRPEVTQI